MGRNKAAEICASGSFAGGGAPTDALSNAVAIPQPPIVAGNGVIREVAARLAMMRSLLIMMGADKTSRKWRPMLNSVSLRKPVRPQARIELMTIERATTETCTFVSVIIDWNSSDAMAFSSDMTAS